MTAPEWVIALLRGAGLHPVEAQPLTGGVSSDVWRVQLASGASVVAKRAVEQLRVQSTWTVPLSRNAFEVRYLTRIGELVPGFVPHLVAHDEGLHAFAMEDLGPRPTWRDDLSAGRIDRAIAAVLGRQLALSHAATAASASLATEFATDGLFDALRIEPYLRYTARQNAEHAGILAALADRLAGTHVALVHGDVSPKNVIVTDDGPVLTDAECAWYGDPAFDIAFCLNHLLLKQIWKPIFGNRIREAAHALADAYLSGVTWESPGAVAARAAQLLPALTLARVDGRSPVDYLTVAQQSSLRDAAGMALHETGTDPLAVSLRIQERTLS